MRSHLDPVGVAPTSWHNGAGSTRELASRTASNGSLLWRISVADLEHDAEFSVLPQVNRLFVPLGSVQLTIDGEVQECEFGDQVRFLGEAKVFARVAAPTRALNVMTRRGAFRAEATLRSSTEHPARWHHGAEITVLLGALAADVRLIVLDREFYD